MKQVSIINNSLDNTATNLNRKHKKKNRSLFFKINVQHFLLCLPLIIKIIIFSIIPMLWLLLAFQNFIPHKGIFYSEFIGFGNFELLFRSDLGRLVKNAVILQSLSMIIGPIVTIFFSLLMYELGSRIFLKSAQSIMLISFFIAWPLVGAIVRSLLGENTGMITVLIGKLTGKTPRIYDQPDNWRFILLTVRVWKDIGINTILYYAVLLGNDKNIYEAADIDGANRWQKMWYLSIPSLTMMIFLGVIMSSANIIRVDFSWTFYTTNNRQEIYPISETIEVFMFNALRRDNNYMIGTAVGLVQSFIGLFLSFVINKTVKKISPESSVY